MKKLLFILASIFVLASCSQNVTHSEKPTIITGVVKKISLTSGKRQWFRVTIQDLRGASHEYRTRDLSYNIGDTIQTEIGD
jgi:hypothetical protein